MASENDHDIIRQVLAGDERRYGVLVDRHKDRAMTLAMRLLANREEAEEVVQDAFVRAFRSLGRFRGDSQFTTWFYRILHNVAISTLKRRGKVQHIPYEEDAGLDLEETADDARDVLAEVEQQQLIEIMEQELGRLAERYRVVLTLFYVQEMKYEEIASVLELPMGTVKTLLFRGRESLRRALAERLEQELVMP